MPSISSTLDNAALQSGSSIWRNKILPALLAGSLGTLLIFGMGFSTTSQLHNAAHDGRHSAGFPCH